MDKPILEILAIMQATPADYFIFFMGVVVFMFTIFLCRWIIKLSGKYQTLNANHLVLWSIVAPEALKWHHTGEYHIDIKSLVDLAEKMNKEGG